VKAKFGLPHDPAHLCCYVRNASQTSSFNARRIAGA
jgi:hypothetical protein